MQLPRHDLISITELSGFVGLKRISAGSCNLRRQVFLRVLERWAISCDQLPIFIVIPAKAGLPLSLQQMMTVGGTQHESWGDSTVGAQIFQLSRLIARRSRQRQASVADVKMKHPQRYQELCHLGHNSTIVC
jgi:hypothetical protein